MGGGAEPTVAIVILAAGRSSRMGSSGCHKLLAEFDGMPLVRRSAYTALACQSHSVIVVTGFRDADIRDAIAGLGVQTAFRSDEEGSLMDCESPFKFYDRLKESQIFRFLKLIGCTNQQVGEFAKFVKRRNKIAHPTGTVFFNDQAAIDTEIADMMKEVRNIETHMQPVIIELYQRFLKASADLEERQYTDPADELAANLIHTNYMSAAALVVCAQFDISELATEVNYEEMQVLHAKLVELHPPEDMDEAA